MLCLAWEKKWCSHEHPSCPPPVPEIFFFVWDEVLLESVCVKCPSCVLSCPSLLPTLSPFTEVSRGAGLRKEESMLFHNSHPPEGCCCYPLGQLDATVQPIPYPPNSPPIKTLQHVDEGFAAVQKNNVHSHSIDVVTPS